MTAKPRTRRHCHDCGVDITTAHKSDNPALCVDCYEAAGLENDHNDNGHPEFVEGCPVCDDLEAPVLVEPTEAPATKPTGRKNFDHSACRHESTKAARAKCRRAMGALMADIAALRDIHDHE